VKLLYDKTFVLPTFIVSLQRYEKN